ncbi:natriuretic peptides B [Thalassophryne amazonica]|uniref:natriuretic peptides B n=1 Tax=Thalassophryne amazonica TaxID=390379 RepID=UPI00147147F1|nr:natriuretic peptides B [Thalassophryne amazonica]
MQLFSIPVVGVLLLGYLRLSSTVPISPYLSDSDMDTLTVLLQRLEKSISDQDGADQIVPEQEESFDRLDVEEVKDKEPSQTGLSEATIRELLSAKNLKSVRSDSSRRSSSCFGQRMVRIGSMSPLGCNTVRTYGSKSR